MPGNADGTCVSMMSLGPRLLRCGGTSVSMMCWHLSYYGVLVPLAHLQKEEEGKAKGNMVKDGRNRRTRAGWRSWNEVRVAANERDSWIKCVEALCATWLEVDR